MPAKTVNLAELPPRTLLPGTEVRFVHGTHLTLAYWRFDAGVPLPEHAHPHEQVTTVLEGTFELTVDGTTTRLEAGMVAVIPPQAVHSGRALSPCRIVDAFHPVRDDYR